MGYTAVKDLITAVFAPLEKGAIKTALFAKFPWMTVPIIKTFISNVVDAVVDLQFDKADELALRVYIQKYKRQAGENFSDAVDRYDGATNVSDKELARQEIIVQMRKLGRFVIP